MKNYLKVAACLVTFMVTVMWGFSPAMAEPKQGGTLTFVYQGIGSQFNPTIAGGSFTGLPGTQLFATLLRFDDQWKPHPYLAESWETAKDGLSVTVHLRKNAKFHDGQPITSEDVAFSIETVKANHPFKTMYSPVTSIDTPDKYTVIIHLSHPHPALLLAMSSQLGAIIPKHIYGVGDIRKNPRNSQNVVGSGPFKLKEFKPGDYLIMERFDDYFLPGKPYLDRIVFQKMGETTSRTIALESGKADMTGFVSDPQVLTRLKKNADLSISAKGYEGIGPMNWLAFNTVRKPFDDKRVRQAIGYAMDKKKIIDIVYGGFAQRAPAPIHPGSPFTAKDINMYKFNLKKAGALLDEAGLKADENGVRFQTTLNFIPGGSTSKRWAELTKAQLKKVGIEVTLKASSGIGDYLKSVAGHDFDMTLDSVFNWGDPVIGVARTYLTSNIIKGVPWHNTQQYKNAVVDALFEQAGTEPDFDKRKALYDKVQKIIVDDAPIIFINASPYHTVWNNKRVGNPPIDTIWGLLAPWDNVYIK